MDRNFIFELQYLQRYDSHYVYVLFSLLCRSVVCLNRVDMVMGNQLFLFLMSVVCRSSWNRLEWEDRLTEAVTV